MNSRKMRLRDISCGVTLSLLLISNARADYAQSLGQSETCIALGGACTAIADDFGAYYHNPAGAASFTRPMIGANFRVLDTRGLDLKDSAGNHDVPKTNTKGTAAIAPTVAGYIPVAKDVTVGLAIGAPFAITGDWTNKEGIHRYNMTEEALFILDATPTIAWKANEKLSFGIGLNVTAFKHLRTETLIPPNFGQALGGPPVAVTPTNPIIGSITLQTDKDAHLGVPPDNFSSGFDEMAFTLGTKYQVNEQFAVGAVYRGITRSKWKGTATLDLTPAGLGVLTSPFKLDMDLPGHFQAGFAWDIVPNDITWSFDIQRTFWSDTRGFGTRSYAEFSNPLLGVVNRLKVDYRGRDTSTYRTGVQYRINPITKLLFGYAYDEHIFDSSHVDILTYDSDRHIFSIGANFDLRDKDKAGWNFTTSAQIIQYVNRRIAAGQSQNLGGVSSPSLDGSGTLSFVPNTEAFKFGGNIKAIGFSAQYSF